ncbi:MAG: TonB-dependent receptor, partial [Bacteroidota bacterium]
MKAKLLLIILFLTPYYSQAQSYTVKGIVADTLNANTLQNASVILTRSSDSIMVDYARTKADGSFVLHPKEVGKYNIMITFPGFADFIDVAKVATTAAVDMGRISMISRNHLLSEFVLKQQIGAIKIKGDTTEYVADSFKVKDNATVEELLKRLPGLQVNKNGEVVAQGEKVEKILVDGEEFFSDDPAVVIKNLQANAIDKVQVFDKKSDQATFTGIDDGQKTKTINLQLKEDKKKGYFGKVNVGGGDDGYFENQAMINAFKGKRQISVFGIASNTGQVGLGWQDKDKFGSGNGTTTINDDGGIITSFTNTNDDPFQSWDGKYNGQGLPTVWTGGVHYADKWNGDNEHLTGNYRFAQQNVEIGGNTVSQNPLLNSGYLNREHKDQFSTGIRHNVDGMFEWKVDSLSTLKLSVDAGYRDSKTTSTYTTDALNTEKDTLSHALRNITSDGTSQKLNADLIYRKKFEKKGRTLSIDVKENYQDSRSTGHLSSNTLLNLFDTSRNLLGSKDSIINQQKTNNSTRLAFSAKATYTEPLSKVAFLELNYGASINNSKTDKGSYDTSASGKNDVLNPLYSSNYAFNIFTNTGGSTLRFVYKKINFSFGGDVSNSAYKQTNLVADTTYSYNYVNFYPRATFNYKMDKTRNFVFNYAGSTKQPTIDQIQPLKDNTDPMNIAVGNTKLKQEFDNSFNVRYNDFKILTNRYLSSN